MKLLSTTSLLLVNVFISSSCSSPVNNENNALLLRNSPNTCSASYIQSAESRANKSLRQTISTLCSSLQAKHKTTTHSIYTETVTPRTTIETAATASRRVVTVTRTAEVTQQSTDVVASTSVVDVTNTYTDIVVVETDTVTVTAQLPVLRPRNQYPCQEIESLLSLAPNSATPFCSCYEYGPTSTKTVTCSGATTAQAVRTTDTETIAPTPSTAFQTVSQTTTEVTPVSAGTVVNSTFSVEVAMSAT